jgi:hypothetical protein
VDQIPLHPTQTSRTAPRLAGALVLRRLNRIALRWYEALHVPESQPPRAWQTVRGKGSQAYRVVIRLVHDLRSSRVVAPISPIFLRRAYLSEYSSAYYLPSNLS